jgi:hypothetical protein
MSIINVNEIGPVSLGSTVTFTSGSTVKVSNLAGNGNTINIPSGQVLSGAGTIRPDNLDVPLAHLVKNAYTVPDGWSNITWDSVLKTKYFTATASSSAVQFQKAGLYEISVGWRFGVGGDVWTTVRLNDGGTVRGLGYGTGNITNDPGPCLQTMFCTIPTNRLNTDMQIQFYRGGSTMAVAGPGAGYAINCIVKYIGVI